MTTSLPILMYHAVAPVPGPLRRLGVPPAVLREQLETLLNTGFRLTGLSEALTGDDHPTVALTFDDAYRDFLDAVPILADVGATATLYVPAGHVGARATWVGEEFAPILDWAAIRDLASVGVEIGNHGLLHEPLDVIRPSAAAQAISAAKDLIETAIDAPVRTFAYPHGYHDTAVRRAVAATGHDNACTIGHRTARLDDDDAYALPRLQPGPDHSGADLLRMIRETPPPSVRLKQLAQPGWRLARRLARAGGATVT
jgi:peptidoglycan/xylan/chitin deacetylase (PgdA/CDA1 family)